MGFATHWVPYKKAGGGHRRRGGYAEGEDCRRTVKMAFKWVFEIPKNKLPLKNNPLQTDDVRRWAGAKLKVALSFHFFSSEPLYTYCLTSRSFSFWFFMRTRLCVFRSCADISCFSKVGPQIGFQLRKVWQENEKHLLLANDSSKQNTVQQGFIPRVQPAADGVVYFWRKRLNDV